MSSRKWAWGLACIAGVWGCKPPEIVPVAPPGLEYAQQTEIPEDQRVTGVLVRAGQIQQHLARPVYRSSTLPRELRDRVEDFTRSASAHQLSTRSALLQLEA